MEKTEQLSLDFLSQAGFSSESSLAAEATDIPHKHFDGNGLHGAPRAAEL